MARKAHHNRTIITELIKEHSARLKALKYSSTSIKAWNDRLLRLARFMEREGFARVQDVTVADLEKYRLELVESSMASSTVYIYLNYAKRFFKYLEDTQRIFTNPAGELQLPKCIRRLQSVPDEDDMKKLLNQPDTSTPAGIRDRALIEVAYSTGLRLEELSRLKLMDPDLKNRTIRIVGKGRKERVVPLGSQAIYWLKQYIERIRPQLQKGDPDQQSLWLSSTLGRKLHPVLIERGVREYAMAAGTRTKITPHAIRRACATHMLRGGAHPVEVQLMLGHSSLSTLSQYLKVSITDLHAMHRKSKPGR